MSAREAFEHIRILLDAMCETNDLGVIQQHLDTVRTILDEAEKPAVQPRESRQL